MPGYNYPGYKSTGEGWLGARPDTVGGYHGGTDNPAAAGTPVYAEHGGKVFRSGPLNGYGMSVVVKSIAPDGTPFYELYGHLGPGPLPEPGADIAAGKPIPGALIGETEYVKSKGGISTGPHLHREIISGKVRLNPEGPLGLYSSEIEHKADPEAFDVNHPVFPYENHEPLPAPVPSARFRNSPVPQPATPSPPSPRGPDASSSPSTDDLPASQLLPGMPIPGAVGLMVGLLASLGLIVNAGIEGIVDFVIVAVATPTLNFVYLMLGRRVVNLLQWPVLGGTVLCSSF